MFSLLKKIFGDHTNLPEPLENRFAVLIKHLNNHSFNGSGSILNRREKSFDLYDNQSNQMLHFSYNGFIEELVITWKYKYYQEELVQKFYARDKIWFMSNEEQTDYAKSVIQAMKEALDAHKERVHEKLGVGSKVKNHIDKNQIDIKQEAQVELDRFMYIGKVQIDSGHGHVMGVTMGFKFGKMNNVLVYMLPMDIDPKSVSLISLNKGVDVLSEEKYTYKEIGSTITINSLDYNFTCQIKTDGLYLSSYILVNSTKKEVFKNVYLKKYQVD